MEKELKEEIEKMITHTEHWIKATKHQLYKGNKPAERCLENAKNGTTRIKELIKEE